MRSKLWLAVKIGAVVGALCGAGEAGVLLARISWGPLDTQTIAKAMLIYGLLNAVIVGVWGLLAARSMDAKTFEVRTLAFSLLTMGYLFGGLYVNRLWLPEITTLPSLVFTGSWTFVWLAGVWALLKIRTSPRRPPRTDFAWVGPLRIVAAGLAVVAGLSFVPPHLPSKPSRSAGVASTSAGPAERPNVLLIVMDTTRADHFSSYGYPRNTTPHLDRLAQEGVLFEQASASAPWTVPSHASLFTGLYVSQHGAAQSHKRLDDHLLTVAELLHEHGYQTAGFSNNAYISQETNFHQGFEVFEESRFFRGQAFTQLAIVRILDKIPGLPWRSRDAHAARTNEHINRWFEDVYDRSRPFFLFVNYMEPHFPYKPPEPYRSQFLSASEQAALRDLDVKSIVGRAPPAHLDPAVREALTDLYDGEIAYLDMRIGELLEKVTARQLLDNTVVIVTSDHGENIGDHELLGHQYCVYETLLHVPLIVRYPKYLPAGTRVTEPVSLVDVMPTLLKLLDVTAPTLEAALPGYSFVGSPLAVPADRLVLAEHEIPHRKPKQSRQSWGVVDPRYSAGTLRLASLRDGDLKFIWASDGAHELYDLSRDPAESRNVIGQFPAQAEAMEAELHRQLRALQPVGSPEPVPALDPITRRQLRALGYLQ